MKTILRFFKQRWFISLLGVIALGILIWFVGPLFAFADYAPLEAESIRWLLIGSAFLFWIVVRTWSHFIGKKQNGQVMAAIAGGEEDDTLDPDVQASQDEFQTLKNRMQEALMVLKKTRLGSGPDKKFLYQLPWYIIIGPPGAGKTTLLKNSNLKFPLSDSYGKDAVRGVGGTRNCDWWFAEDAVLLDTAGRYTTQDSNEAVDQAAWLGFLDILKKNRSRRPINGVIIAVSISDLLQQNSDQTLSQARSIRKRIQELQERFNIRFPVYLLFTKCDLLAGFMEYFDDLDRENRSQVWGMTFKLDEKEERNVVKYFSDEFELLQQQLQKQLLDKLERERGGARRNLIYTFPLQFSAINELIIPFLEELFLSSKYSYDALFRGIYFTSATQEGSPIDRILGTLSTSFGLDRQELASTKSKGKSFFINSLLRNVIFAESGLAGANLKQEKKLFWMQKSAYIGIAALTVLLTSIWVTSYIRNKSYIQDVSTKTSVIEKKVKEINLDETDPLLILSLLDQARALPGGYSDQLQGNKPWSLTFGLYQGDKLGVASAALYRRLLKNVFLSRLMFRIEKQLQSNTNNSDYLYEALKVYLQLASTEHYDASAIAAWFKLDWKYNLPLEVTTEQRESLIQHLAVLLDVRPAPLPRPINNLLVKQTREILQNTPIAERFYARLKLELNNNHVSDYRVSDKSGRDAPLVLSRKSGLPLTTAIPGLFTCAGYKDVFLKNNDRLIDRQAGENWVFGIKQEIRLTIEELRSLHDSVLKLYMEDYIKYWEELLDDVQIKSFSSQAQMVEVLNIISGKYSPIKLFLESVDQETSMSCLNITDKSLLAKAEEKWDSARSSLDTIMGAVPDTHSSVASEITTNMVTDYFKGLHELVQSKDGVPPPLDRTLSVLNELYVYLDSLIHASGDERVLEYRKQIIQVIEKVKREGKITPFPINRMVDNIASSSYNLVSGGVKKHLNAMWRSSVLPFCKKAIQGLYPISNNSREITFEDFTYFFGPGGLMDEFFNKYLAVSVEKGGKNWHWNSRGGGTGISYAGLKQFQQADNIKNTFFRMGKQSPKVSFKLKPISMSPSIVQFAMDIDGQVLTYAHGPVRPVAMKWPGPNNSGQVRIQLLPPLDGYSGLSKDGPWALFRLFDKALITRTSNPTLFIMTFNIQGREAKFELQANSAVNPFQLTDLQSFKCLQNL